MSREKIEEETYSLIFKSLKHPIRRKILRVLADRALAFSEILGVLSIDSGHLSYHIENLGDLVKHSTNGKYELSGIGVAAVDLMSGVEERPQLLTLTGKLRWKKIRYVLMGAVLAILIASAALNIYFFNSSKSYFNSLQASLEENLGSSCYMAMRFERKLHYATSIGYLIRKYAINVDDLIRKYGGYEAWERYNILRDQPNEDNIGPLIEGFFYEIEDAFFLFLTGLRYMNPELSEYEKPLWFIDDFIHYSLIGSKSFTGGPTVRSVFTDLRSQAKRSYPSNYSTLVTAFKELNQTSFQKIDELGEEVLESFCPFNATRLENTVNMVEELQSILGKWMYKYS